VIRALAVVLVTAWVAWVWHTWRQLVRKDERGLHQWNEDDW
jgi:hypothetical protein